MEKFVEKNPPCHTSNFHLDLGNMDLAYYWAKKIEKQPKLEILACTFVVGQSLHLFAFIQFLGDD